MFIVFTPVIVCLLVRSGKFAIQRMYSSVISKAGLEACHDRLQTAFAAAILIDTSSTRNKNMKH